MNARIITFIIAVFFMQGITQLSYAGAGSKVTIEVFATFSLTNSPPMIENIVIAGSSGAIDISYDLADNDGDLCDVTIEIRGGSLGNVWTPTTVSGPLVALIPGTGLVVTWHSDTDIPTANGELYSLRIKAHDGTRMDHGKRHHCMLLIRSLLPTLHRQMRISPK